MWPLLGPLFSRRNLGLSFASALISPHQPSSAIHQLFCSPLAERSSDPSGPFSGHLIFTSFLINFCLFLQIIEALAERSHGSLLLGTAGIRCVAVRCPPITYHSRSCWTSFRKTNSKHHRERGGGARRARRGRRGPPGGDRHRARRGAQGEGGR